MHARRLYLVLLPMAVLFCVCLPLSAFMAYPAHAGSPQAVLSTVGKGVKQEAEVIVPDPKGLDRVFIKYHAPIAQFDLYALFKPCNDKRYIGFIGTERQRFYIHFSDVVKHPDNPYQYIVRGKTKIKNNICTFTGIVTITEAALLARKEEPGDGHVEYKDGFVLAQFMLREDEGQRGSGMIRGMMVSDFTIDKNGMLAYCNLMPVENNQFAGTWTHYKTGASKVCNFGHDRIPANGLSKNAPLGEGDGVFIPDASILDRGWATLRDCNARGDGKACEEERREWWKE